MVYNEMFTVMPNNGFGSPTSPPDVFREVPSPSQYSGPPSTPPSLHSPPHYTSISPSADSEKFESFIMKEEPLSPYSNGYSSGTLIAGQPETLSKQQVDEEFNMQLSSLAGQYQQQQYIPQEQLPYYHQHQQQKELEQMKLHQQRFLQQKPQSVQVDVSATHQQAKSHQMPQIGPDFVVPQQHSNDGPASDVTPTTDTDLPMWCLKVLESIVTPDSEGQQQSEVNRPFLVTQQHQQPQQLSYYHDKSNSQDQQLAESAQLPNLEEFTAISPNTTASGGQTQSETSAIPNQTNVGTNSPASDNGSDIKMEDNSGFQYAAAKAVDTIVQNGITEAGISHNPSEWSVADVKLWFKKCSEGYGLGVFEINPSIQIDGEMLLTMTPAQFGEAIGLNEGELLRECLSIWIARRTSQNSESYTPMMESTVAAKQIKLENLETQELMQIKQEVVSHSMLPVSVACANQAQSASSAIEQSVCVSSFNNNSGNQSLPGHLQQSTPSQVMQHGSHPLHGQKRFQNYQQQQQASLQRYQTSQNMQLQLGQQQPFGQQQQCFTQRSVPPQQPQQQNLLTVPNQQGLQPNQGRMASPMHGMTASPAPSPGSPAEAQMSSMMAQAAIPSSTSSHPVPLQEGINGYIDESGADLSVLLQQTTVTNSAQQHPATLDQDDLMDTDDESDEDPPSSSVARARGSSTGRTHIQLWQFLKELLNNNKRYGSCIRWIDRQEAIFKIEDSVKVATLWGERKNRPHMNYDKLSRSIRQYYNKNIMKKTARSQRLVYQFVRPYGD